MGRYGVNSGSVLELEAVSCGHGNETSGSINCWEILE
jgi:hypothetical protein